MHSISKSKGYIKGKTLGADYKIAAVETIDFSMEYIQDMQYIMNLELNFVNNNDMKLGEYDLALVGFENVVNIKPDHAFGWYYSAKCYSAIGNHVKASHCEKQYIVHAKNHFWK